MRLPPPIDARKRKALLATAALALKKCLYLQAGRSQWANPERIGGTLEELIATP
jgi:hypothetical protein